MKVKPAEDAGKPAVDFEPGTLVECVASDDGCDDEVAYYLIGPGGRVIELETGETWSPSQEAETNSRYVAVDYAVTFENE